MPPIAQSPIEQTREEAKTERKGISINREFNTTVPNFIFNPALWYPTASGRKPSADVVLCYLWCLDKVTAVYLDEDGTMTGKVINGMPIGFAVIANVDNLDISWSSVQRNMKHLERVGLIRLKRTSIKEKYSIEVLNCRRSFDGKQADGTIKKNGRTFKRKEKEEIDFADETKTTSFDIEDDEDDLV